MNVTLDSIYDTLIADAGQRRIPIRLIEHASEGQTDLASILRGHSVSQAAKAIVLAARQNRAKKYYLAVVGGNNRVDTNVFRKLSGFPSVHFAAPERAEELTRCMSGSIPPFSFNSDLRLVVDADFLKTNSEIVFNAGRLDVSIAIAVTDYIAWANPQIMSIAAPTPAGAEHAITIT